MAQRVIIPRMGQTMTEGLIAKWHVKDGDAVNEGDDIYDLEYDKSTSTVQARKPGIVKLLFEEGAVVPLGDAVAVILEEGEEFDESMAKSAYSVANAAQGGAVIDDAAGAHEDGEHSDGVSDASEVGDAAAAAPEAEVRALATPFVRKLALKMGIDISAVARPGERVTKEDLENYGKCGPVSVSPLAEKYAAERSIDIGDIKPIDGKRVTTDDVLEFVEQKSPQAEAAPAGRRETVRGMRKAIADNMTKSYFTYPTVTLTTDADMSALMSLREQMNSELEQDGIKLTITDILVKAVAKALVKNEIVNTTFAGEEIIYHDQVNIGVAVALEKGLVVPVVKNADKLGLPGIAAETKRLIGLAKSGQIGGDDMSCGTFTVTNLGTMGIDAFNPIINYPQSAILGVGRTVKKPVVTDDDRIVIQPRAVLSLTHDHRVIDGAPAAYFLQTLVRFIENPFLLLVD